MSARRIRNKVNDNEQRPDEGFNPKFSTRVESWFETFLAFIQLVVLVVWVVLMVAVGWAVVPEIFWALFMKWGN